MSKKIRLTESDLHKIIKESVNNVLNEMDHYTIEKALEASPEINRSSHAWTDTILSRKPDGSFTSRSYERERPYDYDYLTAANGIRYIWDVLDSYDKSYHGNSDKAQVRQCMKYLEYINNFLRRKSKQQENLESSYEDYCEKEERPFYEMMGKLFGIEPSTKNQNGVAIYSRKDEEAIEDNFRDLPEDEYNKILSKLPEATRRWIIDCIREPDSNAK